MLGSLFSSLFGPGTWKVELGSQATRNLTSVSGMQRLTALLCHWLASLA